MKKLFTVAAAAAMALGITSCSKVGPGNETGGFGAKTQVDLVINTDADDTRAEGDLQNGIPAESTVSSLEIYVFNSTGTTLDPAVNAEGTQGYLTYSPVEMQAMLAGAHDGRFVATTEMSSGTAQVLAVFNANLGTPASIATGLGLAPGTTPSMFQIMGLVRGTTMTTANTRTIPTGGFVMAGHNLAAEILPERSNRISVPVYRNTSRVEGPQKTGSTVSFSQLQFDKLFQPDKATNDPTYITVTPAILNSITFTIDGYAIVSGLRQSTAGFVGVTAANLVNGFRPGYLPNAFTYSNEWTNWAANAVTPPVWALSDQYTGNGGIQTNLNAATGEGLRGGRIQSNSYAMKLAGKGPEAIAEWTSVYSGVSGTSSILPTSEVVYIYESKPGLMSSGGANPHIAFNADQVIAYIVRGVVTYDGQSKTRYWRVNVRSGDAYHAIRNSVYKLEVNNLVTGGYATPWEAEEDTPIIEWPGDTSGEFNISIVPWDTKLVGNGQL